MADIKNSLYNIRLFDELSLKKTPIHNLHPLIKLLTTIFYLVMIVSMGKHEISRLIPFIFYPMLIFVLAELPAYQIIKRLLFIEPLIIGVGILNPLLEQQLIAIGGFEISKGWITFLSIFIKYNLTVTACILLISTTSMLQLSAALRILRVPRVFVLQLLLTYRYISVLIEELFRMYRAYSLRAPQQKGIHKNAWGSFAGHLLLRTIERAQRVYQAMNLRGFSGEYHAKSIKKLNSSDYLYFAGWSLFFVIAKIINIPILIGSLFTGVIK